MAKDNLILKISPALLEAMGLPGDERGIDYFRLLGLDRAGVTPAEVDRAVMARSKSLRQWQNSPQHGEEAVKLLPMMHRIASVLKDPGRRSAYAREVDRLLSGEKADPREEFRKIVKAALADGRIDQASKAELLKFARENGVPNDDAGRILNELMTAATEAAAEKSWQFQIEDAAEGPDAFRGAAARLIESGAGPEAMDRLIAEHERFRVTRESAASIARAVGLERFRRIVRDVAGDGALNDNQARLLMPKAAGLGVAPDQAYEVISQFTFTSASQEELMTLQLGMASFDDSDIDSFLGRQSAVMFKKKSDLPKKLAIGLVVLVAGGFGMMKLVDLGGAVFGSGGASSPSPTSAAPGPGSATRPGGGIPPGVPSGGALATSPGAAPAIPPPGGSPAAPAPTPAPTATPVPRDPSKPWTSPQPDPPSGLVEVPATQPDDPPTFRVAITEVTCGEYQKFMSETFHVNRPLGWGIDFGLPEGVSKEHPVTGITPDDVAAFCKWKAKQLGVPEGSVRPPTLAEFRRLFREPLAEGRTAAMPNFWRGGGFDDRKELAPVRANKDLDALFLPGGQVYDLVTNVAEWGEGEEKGERLLLGGDHALDAILMDPRKPRSAPAEPSPSIGFRYVVTP